MAGRDAAGFRGELDRALRGRGAELRGALVAGVLNRYLPKGRRAVLVGGALVSFYTNGAYTTADVDLVGDREAVASLLRGAGFEESGRYFADKTLGLVVEVPGAVLRPTETVLMATVEGYAVPLLAPEDALVDRLLAAKYWKSVTDWEQAILLWATLRDRFEAADLRRKAEANEVADLLDELNRMPSAAPTGRRA